MKYYKKWCYEVLVKLFFEEAAFLRRNCFKDFFGLDRFSEELSKYSLVLKMMMHSFGIQVELEMKSKTDVFFSTFIMIQ